MPVVAIVKPASPHNGCPQPKHNSSSKFEGRHNQHLKHGWLAGRERIVKRCQNVVIWSKTLPSWNCLPAIFYPLRLSKCRNKCRMILVGWCRHCEGPSVDTILTFTACIVFLRKVFGQKVFESSCRKKSWMEREMKDTVLTICSLLPSTRGQCLEFTYRPKTAVNNFYSRVHLRMHTRWDI